MRIASRSILRSVALLALVGLTFLPWSLPAIFPAALSPLLSLGGAISARSASGASWLGLPLLIVALRKGRWFCGHLCPMGWTAEWAGRLHPAARGRFVHWPHLGRPLALLCLGGALAGYPWVIWLDPLSVFSGVLGVWKPPFTFWSLLPGLIFLLVILLSLLAPQAWCYRLCPLGATQDLLGRLGTRWRGHRHSAEHALLESSPMHPALPRRTFLFALLGGVGALASRLLIPAAVPLPVRPPGARDESSFTGLCARCGNCMRVCPARIIQPDLGRSGWTGLLTPVLDFSANYCDEYCNECVQVCPTGAIERLSLEAKRNRSLGLATITPALCLAWNDKKACMVCQEFCPYLAVRLVEHQGVPCPEIDPEQCRGCGACHLHCPARPVKAIGIRGTAQKTARPLPGE